MSGPTETIEGLTVVTWTMTDLGVANLVFVFLLDIAAFALLALFMYRTRSPYRKQIGAIIGARLFGLGTGIAFYAGLLPYSDLSLVPAAYAAQSLIIAWALFQYDFLDVVPLTADTIVDQMADAVVVLDADDRVVDYNPALTELVGRDESVMGRHVDTVLPGLPGALERDGTVGLVPAGAETPQRSYQPQSTPLYDHHDVYRGRLVVLRDVTLQQTRERTLRRSGPRPSGSSTRPTPRPSPKLRRRQPSRHSTVRTPGSSATTSTTSDSGWRR
ncbi:histidine kinase N-terminal 7TM domain-containing protein [Halomicroarcula sp. GCM10025894]|uniref:histidine kinase N-terminal 7TM domain-containing protein n=1 Tax=Halomicroarcula sp. GCM10025894 TaxID=3252673 RepID=UPI00360A5F04